MICLQGSIGALNDLVDAPLDAGRKAGKPIPAGRASPRDARSLAAGGLVAGLALSGVSGPATVAVALAGIGCGYAYDLGLSRTPWSWLPLAVALPLVPVYAWVGAAGTLTSAEAWLVPAAAVAGAGLAISNGLADLERDRSGGVPTVAVRLGPTRAWALQAALLELALVVAALGLSVAVTPTAAARIPAAPFGLIAGALLVGAGILLGRRGGPARRERAWELEAIGVALLGASWLGAIASSA
jgi:4-hydroxybenzoate polyprenyltransferase